MLKHLKSLLVPEPERTGLKIPENTDPERFALAGLLAEVAMADGIMEEIEVDLAVDLMVRQFAMPSSEARRLIEIAHTQCREGDVLFRFTTMAKEYWPHEERIELIEMLWEVVYADGRQDDFEAGLMRRLGGLLHVTDQDRGAARKRVLARRQKNLYEAVEKAVSGDDDE